MTFEEALLELRNYFKTGKFKEKDSFENDGNFFIHKNDFSRADVLLKLASLLNSEKSEYFFEVTPITLIHTRFCIKKSESK